MSGTGYTDPSCTTTAICSKCEGKKTWNYWYQWDRTICDDCSYGKYKDLTKEEAMKQEASRQPTNQEKWSEWLKENGLK